MVVLLLLIGLPLFFSVFTSLIKKDAPLKFVLRAAALAVTAATVAGAALHYQNIFTFDLTVYPFVKYIILALDIGMAGFIVYMGIKYKSRLVILFSLLQTGLIIWLETGPGHGIEVKDSIFADKLSVIMILIVGLIGSLIILYAVQYMRDYHSRHPEVKDRRSLFFTVLLVFMTAMFGLIVSNDLTLMLFFWEITTLCSFLLIGYTKTPEAVKNSFLALTVNVFGGLCFTSGIVILAVYEKILDINSLLLLDAHSPAVMAAVFFLSCAGLTKAAQLPFSKWLLGAMAAPTPTSAMLHSSTMVKAGVYMIIRLAPMLGHSPAGISVTLVGGITFFAAAILAVTQSDAKKILAYSTISNLGLIVACAGIDSADSLWAAVMLIIFHALAKSLLFLTVGSTEYQLGSRNVEDMDGLIEISPVLTFLMVVGIAGMFIAPFGMLISKWAAMKAFVDSGNMAVVLIVAFGSTVTLFFWTKWLGKLIEKANRYAPHTYLMRMDEKISLYLLAFMVVAVCLFHPLISGAFIVPYIEGNVVAAFTSPIGIVDTAVILFMLCLLFILPLILMPFYKRGRVKKTTTYLAGLNTGDELSFAGGMGQARKLELRNWYMRDLLPEEKIRVMSGIVCVLIIIGGFFIAMGGVFL